MLNLERSNFDSQPLIIAIELSLALLIGLGLLSVGLGSAAWILGGMAAGAIVYFSYRQFNEPLSPNRNARKAGQLIVGLSIGLSLPPDHLPEFIPQNLVLLGLPFFLMAAGGAIGVLYARLEKVDLLTGLLATTPGNIGVMASLAADYGKNTALVSLIQLMRFTTVIFAMPLIANVALSNTSNHAIANLIHQAVDVPWQAFFKSSVLVSLTVIVVHFAAKLKVPLAAFLGAILVGLGVEFISLFSDVFQVSFPIAFSIIGQILLGVTIGEYWGINPPLKWSTVARAILPVTLMLIAGLTAATIIHQSTQLSWLSCLLMAAPGGSPEMIAIALTLQQDPEIITIAHVIRLLTINLSLPILLEFAAYQAHQPSDSSPCHTSKSSSSK